MFRIHKEGRTIITITCIVVVLLGAILIQYAPSYLRVAGGVALLILLLMVIYFFRVPRREPNIPDTGQIIAPADGKVVALEEVEEPEYLQAKCKQISIFMSPLNVHINWFPLGGEVVYKQHHHGKYLVAWHPKSSLENERTTTVIRQKETNILIRQIAGAVARRIINYASPGNEVLPGQEMGFIKFGSRVDVLLPLNSRVEVSLHQRVKGGQTILATLR
jgi:phosphatidylserine decarboxylase